MESHAGRRVGVENALQLSAVWACIRQTAQTIATLPLTHYARAADGGREPLDERLSEILTVSPNSEQTATEHWEGQIAWLLSNGNCYAERVNTGRRLSALLPLPASRCEPRRLSDGRVVYDINDRGKRDTLPADKVFHVKGFGFGGIKGLSAIRFGLQSIGSGLAADEMAAKMFANGMNPSGFLKFTGTLTPEQRDSTRELLTNFSGSSKAWKVLVLENGMDWQAATLNPEDAQMLETRQFSVEDICRWFGTPPVVIGHSAKGQTMWGSGVEQILISWMTQGLNPLMRRIESRIGRDLVRPERPGTYVEWNREGILQMESKAKAEFLQTLVNGGMMTPNEARTKLNLPSIPGGNTLLVQGAMITLDQLIARAKNEDTP
ncbi:phage portal protein, HK97 family [Loktanella atrilutea]|uniref:Phage portal protein, HK97 family n=2 Tax=Loktanella atrilutea TaxID=366533 RepID=A0A1M5DK01_LOKAT|nr:phage portal protein, HK97 family [Loktanella atrilutea]